MTLKNKRMDTGSNEDEFINEFDIMELTDDDDMIEADSKMQEDITFEDTWLSGEDIVESNEYGMQNGGKANTKKLNRVLVVVFIIFSVLLAAVILFGLYRMKGRSSLDEHAMLQAEMVLLGEQLSNQGEEQHGLEDGQIAYRGRIYEYNDDLLTFLCLGVDTREDIKVEKIPGEGGQADTIILIVIDELEKQIKMLNISRDTMTKIQIYDTSGIYQYEKEAQLALQYAYGDGGEKSCKLMETAVSKLLYGVPIHGYAALDFEGISDINDAVGGVEVTVIEDLYKLSPELAEFYIGNTIILEGEQALYYVQVRDVEAEELGANSLRIERQKQYVLSFFSKMKQETKRNLSLPLTLYSTAEDYMITSITADQIAYLSTVVLGCSFDSEDMISISGSIEKTDVYEEYIINEQELYDLIIDVFYREIP